MKANNYLKLSLFSAIILAGNLILGYALYQSNQALYTAGQWVQHTEEVIAQSEKIQLISKNIATDTHGFVITGDSRFTASLNEERQTAIVAIGQLRKLTEDNNAQQLRINSLDSGMKNLITFSLRSIDLKNKQQQAGDVTAAVFKTGKYYEDHIETLINAIQKAENLLLAVRKATNRHSLAIFNELSKAMFAVMLGFTLLMLFILRKYLIQIKDKQYRAGELLVANKELIFQNEEKENRAAELIIANKELSYQNNEKENRAAELIIANKELSFQNIEKGNRAAELALANIELGFQNDEKENRAAELVIANEELSFQNQEKESRAAELYIANKELLFQNQEKENRAAELIIANLELAFQNEEKEKQAAELNKVNHLYAFISQISQNILHVKNEKTLFRNACQIALKFGAFKIAWIGLFEDGNSTINMVDQIGIPDEDMHRFKNMTLQANIQQAIVLETGGYFICNEIADNNELESWRPFTAKEAITSCMILPVKKAGITIGTFNLYAEEPDFFNKEEIDLLVSLTSDISFALDVFEKTKKQQEAEELVISNEKRFRALIEKSTDMLTVSTKEGAVLYASPSIKKVLGYTTEELINQSALEFIHPDDLNAFIANRLSVSQSPGQSLMSQQRLKHKNGDWIWCEGTDNNLLDDPGVRAMVSNFRDITERKVMEQQQEFDGNNLSALINNTNDLMWSIDKDFNLITSNTRFDEMVKLMSGREIKKGDSVLSEQFPPAQKERFKGIYERTFAGETFRENEYSPPPFEFWTDTSYAPIRKGDEIIGTVCHSRDVTERKRAEETLKQSEKRLKEAQAIARIGNFEISLSSLSNVWSDGMYEIFGIDKEGVIPSRQLFLSFIHQDDLKNVSARIDRAHQTLQSFTDNFRFIPKDGSIRYGYTEGQFEFDQHHNPIRLFGIFQDVTETKLAELERLKMVNDLMLRNKDLEQFAYIISHNLRAPVANIIGASDALNDKDLSIADRETLNKGIGVSVMRLDSVVQDLNQILQVKSQVNEHKEVVIFSDLVEDIKNSIRNLIDKYGVTVSYDFSDISEFFTLRPYLYSIFYNLITNSVKYRQPDIPCMIRIKSRRETNGMELFFADNGTGINLEKKGGDVFGLYKKFHENGEGKGVGLFMVKTQVEALGGRISIQSKKNKGTEFKIEFSFTAETPEEGAGKGSV
jgi:PAS domain S-box-containing protein